MRNGWFEQDAETGKLDRRAIFGQIGAEKVIR